MPELKNTKLHNALRTVVQESLTRPRDILRDSMQSLWKEATASWKSKPANEKRISCDPPKGFKPDNLVIETLCRSETGEKLVVTANTPKGLATVLMPLKEPGSLEVKVQTRQNEDVELSYDQNGKLILPPV
jgi:hypothetical protein